MEVENLRKEYPGRKAVLDGVTFAVEEKEFVAIFGKSGCGKTTLLNIMGGLDNPTSGSVRIDGETIVGRTEDDLAAIRLHKIGFVFQDFNLLADFTIRENVALPLRFSGRRNGGRVQELLEKFDILHVADESANKVSGGEAQRAAIARAMMNEPRIILADEPTGNLDSENTENVMDMFQLVRRDFNTTILLATHDRDLAEYATTKILLMGGKATIETPEKPMIPSHNERK